MKKNVAGLLLLAMSGVGCATLDLDERVGSPAADRARLQHENDAMRSDVNALKGRVEELTLACQDLQRRTDAAGGQAADVRRVEGRVGELEAQVRNLDSNRQRDKDEIIAAVSSRVAEMLKSVAQPPSRPSGGGAAVSRPAGGVTSSSATSGGTSSSPTGGGTVEHVVRSGQTLVEIARLYNVTVNDIVKANGIASADMIRVGQKLIIPQ